MEGIAVCFVACKPVWSQLCLKKLLNGGGPMGANPEFLTKDPSRSVLQQPVFHTYWTDCTDIETYKSSVRESVQSWVTDLRQNGITDWMVIVVGAPENKKTNKLLPRTTVLDKMKADFGGKQAERCVSLYEPVKNDSRSLESWQSLLAKMRSLIMIAYNRALNRFEENMRGEREKRTDKAWNFCDYFSIQEELAEVMKRLGVRDEALVQYDELDALLTQFVLNSAAGDTPQWLANFKQPCERWEGLYLNTESEKSIEERLRKRSLSLLELRNYLFEQQAVLLLSLGKPWELASRALSFLQNTANELLILSIFVAEEGGVACWGFLSCLEVIHTLAPFNQPNATHAHARHTAPLWAYARDKLQELGKLCSLLPSCPSSAQLHIVIALVCGMGNDPHADDGTNQSEAQGASRKIGVGGKVPPLLGDLVLGAEADTTAPPSFGVGMLGQDHMTPMTRLKDALSSKDSFRKHYLEISEVAISTYKHIGHVRSARLIARDLANFYLSLGQPQQAANFLTDLLNSFADGCWPLLIADTRAKLQTCYRAMGDGPRLLKVSTELACCSVIPMRQRIEAFDVMSDTLKGSEINESVRLSSQDVVRLSLLDITSATPITIGSTLEATATVISALPQPLRFDSIEVVLKIQSVEDSSAQLRKKSGAESKLERKVSTVSSAGQGSKHQLNVNRNNSTDSKDKKVAEEEEGQSNEVPNKLHMAINLDYKQDNTLASAAVVCQNSHLALSRRDSHSGLSSVVDQQQQIERDAADLVLRADEVDVGPGQTQITLRAKVEHKGVFVCCGAELMASSLVLLQNRVNDATGRSARVEVVHQAPRLILGRKGRDLIAGIKQPMLLTVHSGTSLIKEDTLIELRSSRGLLLHPTVHRIMEDGRVPIHCGASPSAEAEGDGDLVRELPLRLPPVNPLCSLTLELTVLALLGPQRDTNVVDHIMSISSPSLSQSRQDVDVHFTPPFCSAAKLHTANLKKFFQVKMNGLVCEPIGLRGATLRLQQPSSPPSVLKDIVFINSDDQTMVVSNEQSCSYMWELGVDYSVSVTPALKLEFGVEYWTPNSQPQTVRTYRCTFDLNDYKTVFSIKAKVEPSKGSEFCRAGTMCHLLITVETVGDVPGTAPEMQDGVEKPMPTRKPSGGGCGDNYDSVMYEVLADQAMWAVCGRTSGVLPVESSRRRQHVTLDVMPLMGGFLPLPSVRLSKYIPADVKRPDSVVGTASSIPRLEPFSQGQVYNFSKGAQVHVLTAATSGGNEGGML